MDAIGLALVSAALFGAMPVAVRFGYARAHVPAPAVVVLYMNLATFGVLVVAALVQGGITIGGLWPFLLAGTIAPGISYLFITAGIREAGSSRASVAFGTAPLFAVGLAVAFFGERPGLGVLAGAFLVVGGGLALAGERDRPGHVRTVGLVYALIGTALFSLRDNIVRHLSLETDVPSMTGGAASLAAALAVTSGLVLLRRDRIDWPPAVVGPWLLPGAMIGLSYVALLEAFYRETVSVVAPIVGTESLFGVAFSALLLHRTEQVGRRLALGALLVVVGGVLIALTR